MSLKTSKLLAVTALRGREFQSGTAFTKKDDWCETYTCIACPYSHV